VVKDDGVVLVLQNGLEVEDEVAEIVSSHRVIGGLCFICSKKKLSLKFNFLSLRFAI